MPFFYTEAALAKAERAARRGASCDRPVETGGVLLGTLCTCPDSGEFFAVATDLLPLSGAREEGYSLTYSGETWRRIQTVVRARQSEPATQTQRIVGQCHGHNFPPHFGTKRCEECDKRADCALRSDFVSADDLLWSRSVFARQPWACCHIFGQDARDGRVDTNYGFRDGRLAPRGFHRIPDFGLRPERREGGGAGAREERRSESHGSE
jgi:hypothetical protein